MLTEASRVKNGVRPVDGDEKKSTTKFSVAVTDSMAVEIRRRVKAKRQGDPYYSRNDFVRTVFADYFRRHPTSEPSNGAAS